MRGADTLKQPLRTQLRKSLLVAPAEEALRKADTRQELEDAWFDFCAGFSDESEERAYLLTVWDERAAYFKKAEQWAKFMRAL
jgi:hypothetical protein